MSYLTQAQLEADPEFQQRVSSVCVQQAGIFKDDMRPDFVATADSVLRGDGWIRMAFYRVIAAAPGFDEKVDSGDGNIDDSLVTDEDLLSATQATWPIVADLFFTDDGTPI